MKCQNCGHEVKEGQKVCTRCGTKVEAYTMRSATAAANKKPMDPKKKKRIIVTTVSAAAVLLVLFVAFRLIGGQYSSEAKIQEITEAVDTGDAKTLKAAVDGTDISTYEAEAFLGYIDRNVGNDVFKTMLREKQYNINNYSSTIESVYDEDLNLLNISRENNKWGVFENYSLSIPKHNVNVANEAGVPFTAEINGEKVENDGSEQKTAELIPGAYDVPLTAEVGEETYDGTLSIPFENYGEGEQVEAVPEFNFVYLTMDPDIYSYGLYGNEENFSYTVNGEEAKVSEDEDQVYGPYPLDEELEVKGALEADGKTFESEPETIALDAEDRDVYEGVYPVSLTFDSEEIDKHADAEFERQIAEDDREQFEENLEEEVGYFIDSYLYALEDMYRYGEIAYMDDYMTKGTASYDTLVSNIENDSFPNLTIYEIEVTEYERDGEDIYIEVFTERLNDNLDDFKTYKTAYYITYDDEELDFTIEGFEDV